jgi:hypothetical protein
MRFDSLGDISCDHAAVERLPVSAVKGELKRSRKKSVTLPSSSQVVDGNAL